MSDMTQSMLQQYHNLYFPFLYTEVGYKKQVGKNSPKVNFFDVVI